MRKLLFVFCLVLFVGFEGSVSAQNVSFYAGGSKTLYDGRYYPALFGEGVAPSFPTFDVTAGCNKQTFFVLFFVKLFVHFARQFRGSFVPVYC